MELLCDLSKSPTEKPKGWERSLQQDGPAEGEVIRLTLACASGIY